MFWSPGHQALSRLSESAPCTAAHQMLVYGRRLLLAWVGSHYRTELRTTWTVKESFLQVAASRGQSFEANRTDAERRTPRLGPRAGIVCQMYQHRLHVCPQTLYCLCYQSRDETHICCKTIDLESSRNRCSYQHKLWGDSCQPRQQSPGEKVSHWSVHVLRPHTSLGTTVLILKALPLPFLQLSQWQTALKVGALVIL